MTRMATVSSLWQTAIRNGTAYANQATINFLDGEICGHIVPRFWSGSLQVGAPGQQPYLIREFVRVNGRSSGHCV